MWIFLLGLDKIVRAEAHALELTRIMGHDGETCMPCHANGGQRSSRKAHAKLTSGPEDGGYWVPVGCRWATTQPMHEEGPWCGFAISMSLQSKAHSCLGCADLSWAWTASGTASGTTLGMRGFVLGCRAELQITNAGKDVICQSNVKPR